ncbi:spore coat protein [Bacillus cytotoxicus]|uniref:Coat F domain protein n=2 Tax=Bacillus cytotoxicus TaxID=580165 RepID=A0AAX2CM51_9BACI|nr:MULTISPECIES: spore coat protein [Bacillus cereus group]ABS23793.1 Coat F domain protein [Bacillus cytotoxicus NVH 391-98]AWC30389.1 spore coat protein [Bacillus cytotoxicus]AWC34432.1 spore coat protein [Bacillus cytotoxicus]AWC38430.1 spore coat protein [Bacillus cytotoxicus]AWC42529.1 spore coat protein [Bacillus cytotoxicus]
MNEKDMVNDYLAGLNASLASYAHYIAESNNEQLRQTLIHIRNQDELRQRKVFEYAKQKNYYKPAAPANPMIVQQLKNELSAQ